MDSSADGPVLLHTRLLPPATGVDLIARPRLAAQLAQAGAYPLTLIAAPAGAGKSSLLAGWAAGEANPVGWVSLEPEDNDPVRFWRYFTAGLQRVMPSVKLPSQLVIPQLGSQAQLGSLDQLCNALASFARPVFLVLDDLHNLENPELFTAMAYLIDHQPSNFHLIVATRKTPALSLARLRAKNRLLEIRARELNFSVTETASLFQRTPGIAPDAAQIQRVTELTRGWAAGIRLMAIALREDPSALEAWAEGRKLAAEYLTSEIIDQLPPDWAGFLGRVAIFEQFSAEMAAALNPDGDIPTLLDQIGAANVFLHRQGSLYQLHPFFREALLQKTSAAQRAGLNRGAAAWYAAHGAPEKAVGHALAAEDWSAATRLILDQAAGKFQRGEIRGLESWISAIPAEIQAQSPDLLVIQGWELYLLGDIPQAQALIEQLERSNSRMEFHHQGWWAGLRCQLTLVQEQNRQALELARQALAETSPSDPFIRGLLLCSLGTAHQALGDSDAAVAAFKQAVETNRQAGNLLMTIFALVSLGIELNNLGQRQRALEMITEAFDDFNTPSEADNPLYGMVDILLARLYWEADDLDAAQQALDRGARRLELLGVPGVQISGDIIAAYLLSAREDYGEALRLINRDRRRSRSGEFIGFRQIFDMLRAEICLKMGSFAAVAEWLDNAHLPPSPLEDAAREMEFVVKARYLVESGELEPAAELLDALDGYVSQTQHVRIAICTQLTRANLEWKKGALGRVRLHLENALALAAPQQYVRLLLDSGAPLLGVLAQLPGAPAAIRARFRAASPAETPGLVEMLTAREIDVLRLLSENCTNPEIAQRLVLSSETVKVHLKHIFQKLDVGDRRQAVRRAHELDLL
jgi:LuxR family transcriptional regulator, maltose regulon positive regulatory protein